jgi:hypothetical protein
MNDSDAERKQVADALRARQSLAADAQPGDVDFGAHGGSGLRFGHTDEAASADEQALIDDDDELGDDKS